MISFSRTALCTALLLTSCGLIHNLNINNNKTNPNNDDNQWMQSTTSYSPEWTTISTTSNSSTEPQSSINKWLASTDDNGNREFLFTDSVRTDKGITTALIEYRYASAQILPENHKAYTHNHWLEQIDCIHHIRTIRATTQYSEDNQIIDANEYPVPKYSRDDLQALSKPDDPIIQKVCDIANNKDSTPNITTTASTPASTPYHPNIASEAMASSPTSASTPASINAPVNFNNDASMASSTAIAASSTH